MSTSTQGSQPATTPLPDFMAPTFALLVDDHELGQDVTDDVRRVSYEHSLDLANVIKLQIHNPDHRHTDLTLWGPGNEIVLLMGYGNDVGFVGRGEIIRHLPIFPENDAPVLEITAYDRSYRMMQTEMPLKGGGSRRPKEDDAHPEPGTRRLGSLSGVVGQILEGHGITPDIDSVYGPIEVDFIQRKGTSDYEVLRSLANVYGAVFVVEWEPDAPLRGVAVQDIDIFRTGAWKGRFIRSDQIRQDYEYKFEYANGEKSTIVSIDLDWGMPEKPTQIQAWVLDQKTKDWLLVVEEETEASLIEDYDPASPSRKLKKDDIFLAGAAQAGPIEGMAAVKLAASGFSIEVLTEPFKNSDEARTFVQQWFKTHKDAFVTAKGILPGIAHLRAGQVHGLSGLGTRYDGDYEFAGVTHTWDADNGYRVQFDAHKVIDR